MKTPSESSYDKLKRRLDEAEASLRAILDVPGDASSVSDLESLVRRLTEVTQREQHLKRVLLSIRNVNQLIVSEDDPERLIAKTCDHLVEAIGCHSAWIALLDPQTQAVTATAASGLHAKESAKLFKRLQAGRYTDCMKRALADNEVIVVHHPDSGCMDCPLSSGYAGRAGLSRRLHHGGTTYGFLSVSVPAAYSDDAEEQGLLREVADDLGFAFRRIETARARRHAERMLEESEKRFRALFEQAPEPIVVVGLDGTILDHNHERSLLGLRRDQLIGRKFHELGIPGLDALQKSFVRVAAGELLEPFEVQLTTTEGDPVWLEIHPSCISEAGQPAMRFAIHDISERLRAAEDARVHAVRLRAIVDILQTPSTGIQEFLDHALTQAIDLTQSTVGYIYFYDEDRREFELNTWSSDVMPQCAVANPETHYALDKTGIWGEAVRQRRPILVNDFPADNPLKKGTPDGHVPLTRFLTVPVVQRDRIVAVVGVANKPTDYTDIDTAQLGLLMDAVWKSVEVMRSHETQQRHLEMLARTERIANIGSWEWDIDADQVTWSEELFRIFQRDPASGAPSFSEQGSLYVAEGMHRLQLAVNLCVSHGTPYEIELRAIRADGAIRHCIARGIPEAGANGRVVRLKGSLQDITERRLAEKATRESEAHLASMLNAITESALLISTDGTVLAANEEVVRRLSPPDGGLIGHSIYDVLPEDTARHRRAYVDEVTASGKPVRFEDKRSGRCIHNSVYPIFDADGRVVQLAIFGEDITERKRTQERIALLGQMLDAAPASITVHDTDGHFLYANRQTIVLHGYADAAEFQAINLHDLDVPESEALLAERFEQIAKFGEAHFEVAHYRRDGSSFPLDVLAKSIEWQGKPAVLSVATDITQRKLTEQAVRHSEARYRAVVENANEAIFIAQDGFIQFANQATMSISGYSLDELISRPFVERVHPDDRAGVSERHRLRMLGQHAVSTDQLRLITRDGTVRWIELNVVPIEWNSSPATLNFGTDITERRLAEDTLRAEKAWSDAMIASAPNLVVGLGESSQILIFNAYAERVTGYRADEVMGRSWIDSFIPEATRSQIRDVWDDIVTNGLIDHRYENEILTKRQGVRWISWSNTILTSPNGEFRMILSIGEDVTERRQVEQELQESTRDLLDAQRLANVGSWSWDLISGDLRLSDEMYNIIGLEHNSDALDVSRHESYYTPESWRRFRDAVETARTTGRPYEFELDIVRKDGTYRTAVTRGEPVRNQDGTVVAIRGTLQDITSRKRVEHALRESEAKYSALFNQSAEGIYVHDIEGRMLDANDMACRQLGYSRDELLHLHVFDILPDTSPVNMSREEILLAWCQWEPGHHMIIEGEHRRKDGSVIAVRISTSLVSYEGRHVILAIVEDITERKQIERYQALSVEVLALLNEAEDTDESLQRALAALLRVTGCDAAAVHLQEGDAVACRALTGFPNDFFRSEDCLLCREPEAAQRADSDSLLHADCACSLVLSGRTDPSDPTSTKAGSIWTNDAFANMQPPRPSTSTCIPLHLRCLDAGYRSMAIIPIPARTGILGLLHLHGYAGGLFTLNAIHALEGIASHLGEMLQRQQTEQALYESEERFRSLYSNTAIGLYRTTPDGRILLANPALVRMLGYSSFRDLAQRDLTRDGYEPGYLRREFVDNMARHGEVQGLESAWTRKDGTTLFVRESCRVIRDADGRPLYYDGTAEDITERKRAEEAEQALRAQLIQAQKLESIGTLASGVAHEINNPLMGVINYADLIQERVEDAETKLFAQGIQDEGNRIAGIVKSLLSFARQDAAHSSPARVVDIIDAAMSLTAVALRRDRIQLEKDVPDTLPDIPCRSQQIQQVVINLLTNARDALNDRYPEAHEDKRIRIAARPFNKKGESWLRVTIEDHGTGIPRDMLARLFDPFFTTKPRDRGTGLGLSVSHGIIESHQGTLWVESRLGEYTRFHIELPTTKQQEAQRAED